MVYYHIDRVQRYIQGLGFNNVLNHPIEVNIDGRVAMRLQMTIPQQSF